MFHSFQLFLFAFSALSSASVLHPRDIADLPPEDAYNGRPLDAVTLIDRKRGRYVVKLDTPGYPLWDFQNSTTDAWNDTYIPSPDPSAILLDFVIDDSDYKILYLNGHPILPLATDNATTAVPPKLFAYQVPSNFTLEGLEYWDLLSNKWHGWTIPFRYLALDYDRLVWSDPANHHYDNHVPTLRFRLMGLGAGNNSAVLDEQLQKVVHVTLADQNHGSSDAPDASYAITNVEIKDIADSYPYTGVLSNAESRNQTCPSRSWMCADTGLYEEGAPWYRYIWRHQFDDFGRIGSLRHDYMRRWQAVSFFCKATWPIWVVVVIVLVGSIVTSVGYRMYVAARDVRVWKTLVQVEELGLLDEGDEEGGAGDSPPSYQAAFKPLPLPPVPPPLPPKTLPEEEDLLVLDVDEATVQKEP